MKTIIGLYDDISTLDRLIDPLMRDGIDEDHIEVVTNKSVKKQYKKESRFSSLQHDYRDLSRELNKRGVPSGDARFFEQGVEQGHMLLILEVDDDRAPRVADYLTNGSEHRTREAASAQKTFDSGTSATTTEKIPVIEEQLHIEKRTRQTGGVEVEKRVESQPVAEGVELRREHVEVSRSKVDRPATEEDMARAFEEGRLEMREQEEEVIVTKEPRVVEEIEVKKTVERDKAQIEETLQRVDVDIHGIEQRARTDMRFAAHRGHYESHFDENLGTRGGAFEDYESAYRYGHGHGLREDWRGHEFDEVSPYLREDYERRYGEGSWERGQGAIRHAFDRARSSF